MIDTRQSAGDVYKANISDMAALLDHEDSDGLLRDSGAGDSGEHTFSEEQEEMYVDTSSAALEFSEA